MFRHAWRAVAVSALLVGLAAATGCAGKRALTEADRAELRKQPVIRVVHYVTPAPSIEAPKAQIAPTGKEVQSSLGGYDPTLDLARRFSGMLARSAGLKNLRIERETTPLPLAKDAKGFQAHYKNGAVLEVWIDAWGFHNMPVDPKTYALSLNGKAKLTRVQDGRVLWGTGSCHYASTGKNFNDRIVLADLKSSDSRKALAKFRQIMGQITNSCAQQLLRDYLKTG